MFYHLWRPLPLVTGCSNNNHKAMLKHNMHGPIHPVHIDLNQDIEPCKTSHEI